MIKRFWGKSFFLNEKSKIQQFPLSVKFTFRRCEWYLFPQGWQCIETVKSEVSNRVFEIPIQYNFSWLFIDFEWRLNRYKVYGRLS
jgi:hypothetical protein